MDYTLCDRTVTVYRQAENKVSRQEYQAYLEVEEGSTHPEGAPVRNFLLVIPGPEGQVRPGDRVFPGIGPKEVDWEAFLPIHVPGLLEVGRVRHYRLGEICHTEAEQGWN